MSAETITITVRVNEKYRQTQRAAVGETPAQYQEITATVADPEWEQLVAWVGLGSRLKIRSGEASGDWDHLPSVAEVVAQERANRQADAEKCDAVIATVLTRSAAELVEEWQYHPGKLTRAEACDGVAIPWSDPRLADKAAEVQAEIDRQVAEAKEQERRDVIAYLKQFSD